MSSEADNLAYINEALRPLAVGIDTIFPDPANENTHPQRNIDSLKASMAKFGQVKPIVVREQDRVIACGNGTFMAAKELGWKSIAANVVSMTASEFAALKIIDNRTAQLSTWDTKALEESLDALQGEFDDLGLNMEVFFSQAEKDALFGPADWVGGAGGDGPGSEATTGGGIGGYEEKLVIRIKDMTVRAPLREAVIKLIEDAGWQEAAEMV